MDMMTDLYPSRVHSRPRIARRRDPVVHGRRPGPLSAAQLAAYERDGFLHLPELFGADEVGAYRRRLEALWEQSEEADRPEIIREPGNSSIRSIFAVHRDDDLFARLARDPRLAAMAAQLLGDEVYIHQSRINFKPGFVGREFYWHSDFETWHVEDGMPRMRALSVSIALAENTPHNGPLMVVPGSHRHYVACVGETPEEHYKQSLRKQEYGVPDAESLRWLVERGGITVPLGGPGSVVVFDCNLMHGSNSNITPAPRSNVFLVYNSTGNRLAAPFGGIPPRPEFIGHRRFTPVLESAT